MSGEINKHSLKEVLRSIEENENEIQQAFNSRAKEDGIIKVDNIMDVLNDVGVIVSYDLEPAKYWFAVENKQVSEYYDLEKISYNDFVQLLKQWIQNEIQLEGGELDESKKDENEGREDILNDGEDKQEEAKNEENNIYDRPPGGIKTEEDDDDLSDMSSNVESPLDNEHFNLEIPPPSYAKNKESMQNLLKRHKLAYYEKFKERVLEENEDCIAIQDYFIFLQECFYLDNIILIEEHQDGTKEDFFRSVNSYKRLFKIVELYYIRVKGAVKKQFNLKNVEISFDEAFNILDFWFKSSSNIKLANQRELLPIGEPVRKMLEDTIDKYQKMLADTTADIEKQILETSIQTLKKKIQELDAGIVNPDEPSYFDDSMSRDFRTDRKREEKRSRALAEIFNFYAKQQSNVGRTSTFETIERKTHTLNLGKVLYIVKTFFLEHSPSEYVHNEDKEVKKKFLEERAEFKKAVDHQFLVANFNKISSNHEDITFEEFLTFMEKIAIDGLFKKSKEYRTDAEKVEAFWHRMGLYDGSWRTKMKMMQVAFHSGAGERINQQHLKYKFQYKPVSGKTADEIREEVKRRNELRKLAREQKLVEKHNLEAYKKAPPEIKQYGKKRDDSYAAIQFEKSRLVSNPEYNKLTLKKIEKFNEAEVKGLDDNFNPHDLIDDNDDEDNIYLAEYNLQPEKQKRLELQNQARKQLENYGNIKKSNPQVSGVDGKYSNIHKSKYGHQTERAREEYGAGSNDYAPMGYPPGVMHTGSQKNLKAGNYQQQYEPSPSIRGGYSKQMPQYKGMGVSQSANNLSYQIHDRARQVENDTRRRENELMSNVMNMHDQSMRKGYNVLRN